MQNVRMGEAQAGIKNARRSINHLRYADDTTLLAESEELKSLLMTVKSRVKKLAQLPNNPYAFSGMSQESVLCDLRPCTTVELLSLSFMKYSDA